MKRTITIAGAGPSGLTAAINLALAGYSVEVYEVNRTAGERFNNCFQILENYTEKEELLTYLNRMNIKVNFFCQPANEINFYDSKLTRCSLKSREPYGYFIRRGSDKDTLDQGLVEQASDLGVKIIYTTKLNQEKADIDATGARSIAGISKEIVFDTNINNTFRVILDNNITPGGFSYLFAINKKGTIGSAVLRKFPKINNFTAKAVDRFQEIEKFEMKSPKEFVSYVDFFISKSAKNNNRLITGEAAGFQDYLFGIGIRLSIQSGYLAAKSIIENIDYDNLWKSQFSEKMKMSIVNRFLYEIGGNIGYTWFNKSAQNSDFKEFGYKLYQPNLFKKFIFPFIKIIWKDYSKCTHGDNCLWCRRKLEK